MFKPSITSLRHSLLAALLTTLPVQNALSAPGTLPTAPLFLSTLIEANLFFTLDDSGSMDWGPIVDEDTGGYGTSGGLPIYGGGRHRGYYIPPTKTRPDYDKHDPKDPDTFIKHLYSNRHVLPPANGTDADWDKGWIFRNHNANKSYYNPDVKYEPWLGADTDGDPLYEEYSFDDVPIDPIDPGGVRIDLNVEIPFEEDGSTTTIYIPTYFVWDDTNSDDVMDLAERQEYYIGTPETEAGGTATIRTGVNQDTDSNAEQNFANWFVYHRNRMGVAKYVFGRTINNTDASRMGMAAYNQGLLSNSASMSATANKLSLLTALYDLEVPAAGTPARRALDAVGKYFEGDLASIGSFFEEDTTATAPILPAGNGGECQQNFNVIMSDGFWSGSIDADDDDESVGNTDINGTDSVFDGDEDQSNDDGNYADGYSNTMADFAMHYYERDLNLDIDNEVPTLKGVDESNYQHLVTYTIGFGINGTLDPTTADPLSDGFEWPEPKSGEVTTVDDMWHASYNGRGKHLAADNPSELQASLEAAVKDITKRTATSAAVAVNSAQLSLESVIYLAKFNSDRWQGHLLALPIVKTATGELGAAKWDASEKLTARDVSTDSRTIITYNNELAEPDGVAFQWTDISSDMQSDLNITPTGTSDLLGEDRLDYLRGDRSNEGSGEFFRTRLSMLGDIVNSGPVFVGEPSLSWPDYAPFPEGASAYSKFKTGSAKSRREIVYVGANDAMLHAFDDDTGEEVFAYIPGMLSSTDTSGGLHYLTDSNYIHKFYVDMTPTLSDVFIAHKTAPADWRTVLVGAMRGGARGIYALDVTKPGNFSETNAADMVLWEFTNADDADLGYTYSRPFIAYANNNTWVAIFGNGYNPDTSLTGATGEASLFIVDIEKGTDGDWLAGDYRKISTEVGSLTDTNALATPALADIDGNGTVDRVYAGDLKGNMWAFDLEGTSSSSWKVAYEDSSSSPAPLFTTENNRPITAKPVLAKHPTQPDSSSPSNAPNIMVFFGTGQYLVDADKSATDVESFYGVWDKGDENVDFASDLIEQTFESGFTDSNGNSAKVLSRNAIDYSTDYGWYFKLPESGERAVTSPVARADAVFFNSFVPTTDPCSVGGYGFKFAVDMTTGGSPLVPVFDANQSGEIDESDTVSNGLDTSTLVAVRQEEFLPEPVFIEDLAFTAETATKVKGLKNIPSGRFSWQELLQ